MTFVSKIMCNSYIAYMVLFGVFMSSLGYCETGYSDELFRVELMEPCYRNSIFSTQPNKKIVLQLTYKAELIKDFPIEVNLTDASGKIITSKKMQATVPSVLEISAAELKPGNYVVQCHIAQSPVGAISKKFEVYVLAPVDKEVYFDRQGICYVNGKKFFPRGIYHAGQALDLINADNKRLGLKEYSYDNFYRNIAATGFNVVHLWMNSHENDSVREFLDLAKKNNLQAIYLADSPNFKELVDKYKTHPALFMWAPTDEPKSEETFREVAKRYALLKSGLDVYHPAQVSQCFSDLYSLTATVCDVMTQDSYPLNSDEWWKKMIWWDRRHESPLRLVTRYTDFARQVIGPNKPLWVVIQAFGGTEGGTGNWKVPTPLQLRNMTYQALAGGARGLLFYAYCSPPTKYEGRNTWWIEACPKLWDEMKKINDELQKLEPFLLADGGKTIHVKNAPDVRVIERQLDNRICVIAVNIGEIKQSFIYIHEGYAMKSVNENDVAYASAKKATQIDLLPFEAKTIVFEKISE